MLEDLCEAALSIKFNHSDGEWSDLHSSPEKDKDGVFKVKCFKCYGTNNFNCKECGGNQKIQSTHPMAFLLNDILMKKLNLKKSCQFKEEQSQKVYPIKQQEQELQDKRIMCSYCSKQCEISLYNCQKCPIFNVCTECTQKVQTHPHKLTQNLQISQCQPLVYQNNHMHISQDKKYCSNCNNKIQNCYTLCRTCKDNKINYWICDNCTDNNNFIHSYTHILETVIDYDSFKDNNIDTVSQEFQEEEQTSETFQDLPDFTSLAMNMLQKKNSSIANYLQYVDDCSLVNINPSIDANINNSNIIGKVASRVQFQIDGLFSSFQFPNQTKNSKVQSKLSLGSNLHKNYNFQSSKYKKCFKENDYQQQKNNDFLFPDYKCDICNAQPIRNVRYHCQQCADYDVCEQCYLISNRYHNHIKFQRVDGKQIRQKAMEKMFHNKDLNYRPSYNNIKTSTDLPTRKAKRNQTLHVGNFQSFS